MDCKYEPQVSDRCNFLEKHRISGETNKKPEGGGCVGVWGNEGNKGGKAALQRSLFEEQGSLEAKSLDKQALHAQQLVKLFQNTQQLLTLSHQQAPMLAMHTPTPCQLCCALNCGKDTILGGKGYMGEFVAASWLCDEQSKSRVKRLTGRPSRDCTVGACMCVCAHVYVCAYLSDTVIHIK
jgi:hypothetical protein